MFRHVPNALTVLRLVLAAVFFVLLSFYQYEGRGDPTLLNVSFVVYLVALLTDFFDGFLARRWKVEGVFGRVVDPTVDKVLVLGGFIFFAGKNFIIPHGQLDQIPNNVHTITGVAPWMVVLILARELLVTGLRAGIERQGAHFGATFSGKLKMVLQSLTILVILVYVNYRPRLLEWNWETAARHFRDGFIYLTLFITLWSGLLYIRQAVSLYQQPSHE